MISNTSPDNPRSRAICGTVLSRLCKLLKHTRVRQSEQSKTHLISVRPEPNIFRVLIKKIPQFNYPLSNGESQFRANSEICKLGFSAYPTQHQLELGCQLLYARVIKKVTFVTYQAVKSTRSNGDIQGNIEPRGV